MDEYYRILESLPPALRTPLAKLDAHYAPHIQEIRLRLGQPVQFTICGRLCPAAKFLPGTGLPAALETDTLRDCFLQLCRRSVYAYEDELKQGYFTVQGGCRIGVAGCRGPGGFSAVTSLNLRIARWLTCPLPPELEALTVAPPRAAAGRPAGQRQDHSAALSCAKDLQGDALVSVIDERGELMACEAGSLPRAAQIRCDVYARCTKAEGIAMALRCMNPQVIVCDELGTPGDAEAVAQGVASGVVFFATVHCDDPAGLRKKPALAALLDTGAFCKGRVPVRALPSRRGGAVGDAVTLLLRLLGTLLLLLAGMGGGFAAAARAENSRRQLHSFARLLTYLAELLDAQALTGPELLRRAAQDPAFAVFCPAPGESLSALTPPACMPDALRQEVQSSLSAAEEAPRLTACAALHRLASRCEAQSAEAAEYCRTARRLWPRLGGCLGALAAILLW